MIQLGQLNQNELR